jgi:Siphovirus Gp157
MNITLYQAAEELRHLLDQIDPETGEMPEGFEQARGIVATKATAVAAYLLESSKQADMVEQYAKELIDRVRAQRKRSDWLRQYLASHMAACGITKLTDDRGLFSATLAVGRDKSVDVFDAAQLPPDYMREIPARFEPDKTLIRKAIDDGFEVPGARVVAHDRLTIK